MSRFVVPVVAVLVAHYAAESIVRVAPKPRTEEGRIEVAIRNSQVVMLARVIALDSTATPWKLNSMPEVELRRRRAVLEPIEYVKGGLDGDAIEVYSVEGSMFTNHVEPPLRQMVHVDTLAAFFFLLFNQGDWYIIRGWSAEVAQGAPLTQRTWATQVARLKALADSVASDSSHSAR